MAGKQQGAQEIRFDRMCINKNYIHEESATYVLSFVLV